MCYVLQMHFVWPVNRYYFCACIYYTKQYMYFAGLPFLLKFLSCFRIEKPLSNTQTGPHGRPGGRVTGTRTRGEMLFSYE